MFSTVLTFSADLPCQLAGVAITAKPSTSVREIRSQAIRAAIMFFRPPISFAMPFKHVHTHVIAFSHQL